MLIKGGFGLAFILNEFSEWVHSLWLHSDWIGSLLQIMHVSLKLTISQKLYNIIKLAHILRVQSRISRFVVYTQSFQLNRTNQPSPGTGKARENMKFRGWKMKVIGFKKMNVYIASTLCGCFGCVWITNWQRQKFSHIILGYFQFYVGTQPTSVRIFDGGEILL